MMYSSERLKGLDVFVAVVDAGSFTKASDRLNLTNSAVGKAVARLELRLGVKLFERTTRKLSLTDAGEAFHRTCLRVLGDLEEVEHGLKAQGSTPAGKLRLDLPAAYGKLKVMPLIFDFMERYPAVLPQISFNDRFVDMVEDGIDVAVRIGGGDSWPTPIGHHYLGHERRVFCCAPTYLSRFDEMPDTLELLQEFEAVLYRRPDGTLGPWFIQQEGEPVEHRYPLARLEVGDAEAHVEALRRGLGVGQLPTWAIDADLQRGDLIEIMPSFSVRGLPHYLLWLRSRQQSPKLAAILQHFVEALKI